MRQALSTGLSALAVWGFLAVFFAAPATATSVDIILGGDRASAALMRDIGVTLYNLDTQRAHTGRTDREGLAFFPSVPPGRYRITIEGRGLAHLEYGVIKGSSFARTYKMDDLTTIYGNTLVGSLSAMLAVADEAVEDGDRERFKQTQADVAGLRDLHVGALAQLEKIDPQKGQTELRKEHRKAISQCDKFLNESAVVVWPSRSPRAADPLLGEWTINPIPIKNTEDCGQVFQTGTMTVTERVDSVHWRGTYAFRWDTSKADPACRFKFSKSGTATVDLYLDGTTVTVKYSNTGQNTFADDTLTLNGNVMNGQDATGQVVTYTRQ